MSSRWLQVVERLRDVVIGAELQALDLVHRVVASRQHDHWDIREEANLAEHPEAVQAGQAHVEEHDVGTRLLDGLERLLAGAGPDDLRVAPLEREPEAHRLDDIRRIVHHEDTHQSTSCGPSAGTEMLNTLP